ncbi:DUF1919 domain-containing protein [Butyrivibrio sp. FCS006]|uniref:DUF1919 domain-containing protein n=1 Tax=Butyrivibrio sp. FCS006 TaxID=1280684 RepID=UPI00040DEA75|nr:DUF1919 domain-containing protein [Butyrivibrio sp. FCS006]
MGIKKQIRRIISSIYEGLQFSRNKRIREYNYNFRKRVNNHDFTIISMDCLGGILYHRLGMRFDSPTVNLWMKGEDFVHFCEHLKEYMEMELKFIDTEFDYPVGVLDNGILPVVKLFFLHYDSEEEACLKWESRKKRVNYDNLYIIAKDGRINEDGIKRLEKVKCNNLVVFTAKEYPKCRCVHPIQRYEGMDEVGPFLNAIDDIKVSFIEYEFDFADFLNRK